MGDICQVPVATSSAVCVCHSPSSDTARGACPVLLRGQREPRGCCESQSSVFPKGQAAAAVLPREDEARPGSLFRQLLTDDEDAAAPSLFKLGWLSGMTK